MKLHQATAEQLREQLAEVEAGVKVTTTIIIRPESDPMNPRTEWDNAGTMWCRHSRYNLGDEGADDPYEEVDITDLGGYWIDDTELSKVQDMLGDWCDALEQEGSESADLTRALAAYYWVSGQSREPFADSSTRRQLREDVAAILPLYLYDHSGITMSTGSFSCPWDSGQVGWIYMTKDTIEKEFGGDMEKALACLKCEVETYDQYLTGDVYGFEVWEHEEGTDAEDGNRIDSCWGFYGSDPFENGMSEHIEPQLHELLRKTEITFN